MSDAGYQSQKKASVPTGRGRGEKFLRIHQGLLEYGSEVSIAKFCRWFEVPRKTVYYRATKTVPKNPPELLASVKEMIEENPSFGYRKVAHLLNMNKNTVQRIFQLKG